MFTEIDHSHFMEFFEKEIDSDPTILLSLYSLFNSQVKEFIDLSSHKNIDKHKMSSIAHKIKSSCYTFGFTQLANLLNDIENYNESSENDESYISKCQKSFFKIKRALTELQEILEDELNIIEEKGA